MPMNSAVREMLPEKRAICATRYSRSKISRASRSAKLISFSPPAPFGVVGTSAPISEGNISDVTSCSGSGCGPRPPHLGVQHLGLDHLLRIGVGEDHQPFDVVPQLPDVARPVVRL